MKVIITGASGMVGQGGAADIAVVVPEYAPNDLPLHQIFKSFPTGPTGYAQIAFFWRVYSEIPAFNAELEQANVPMAKKAGATRDELKEAIVMTTTVCGIKGIASCLEAALEVYDNC